jgi:hypothetical protein
MAGRHSNLIPTDDGAALPLINRIEVLDARGRVFVQYYSSEGATLSLQDGDHTLKIFAGHPVTVDDL